MRADFTIGGGSVKKMVGYWILLVEFFSISDEFSLDTRQNPIFL
jgi:hypothetical protein